jgi:peptidoglycan lytic transglycosylase G
MKKNILVISAAVVLLACGYAALEMFVPAQTVRNTEIEIPKGATFRQVVDILSDARLIRDKKVFMIWGRASGVDRRIRAGYYSIWDNMSPFDILAILSEGQIIAHDIRIVEGDSLPEIAHAFAEAGVATKEDFMKLAYDPDFLAAHDIDAPSIEGYIFPDTYRIPKGVPLEDAVGLMIDRMREKLSRVTERAKEIGMTENQVLTLASIIEKEAAVDSERPLISAVYHNRLNRKMPLQADPTAVYGVKRPSGKITRSDLERKTPYNTYFIKGLPPGPIASPGMKSIYAAVYPADVPYLYFVSQDDHVHHFSTTLAEHRKAVKLYREREEEIKNSVKEEGTSHGAS